MDAKLKKVLHVTESLGGGILTILSRISELQILTSLSVTILYTERIVTPNIETLKSEYFRGAQVESIRSTSGISKYLKMFIRIRKILSSNQFDAIHLHSSIAGFLGRMALYSVKTKTKVFYSPHGYSFLNLDQSTFKRRIYFALEQLASRADSATVATCNSEFNSAKRVNKNQRIALVQTGVPRNSITKTPRRLQDRKPKIAMIGRVCVQKNPREFDRVAQILMDECDFIWIGDFDPDHEFPNFRFSQNVKVTGWLNREELSLVLNSIDLLLFQSLWEGFALSIPLAQSRGIPVITNSSPGNIDAVVDGQNGAVSDSTLETVKAIREILKDQMIYQIFSKRSLSHCAEHLTDDHLGSSLSIIYFGESVENNIEPIG